MENQDSYFSRPRTPRTSSSSAINFNPSHAGIIGSAPESPSHPSLEPSASHGSVARRRRSWGQRLTEAGQDPLRIDTNLSGPLHSPPVHTYSNSMGSRQQTRSSLGKMYDSPTEDRPFPLSAPVRHASARRDMHAYPTSEAGPSSASLIGTRDSVASDGGRDDDEAHLTADMSRSGTDERWEADPERSPATTPRSRRRTVRYSASPSPLKKTSTAFKSMSHNLRRASIRVVNLASAGLENQIRLGDGDDDEDRGKLSGSKPDEETETLPDLTKVFPLRGRTLGFLGRGSKLRLFLFNLLISPWTEPFILILIICNAIVLTIQASSRLTLSTSDGSELPPRVKGYFHSWDDYALFALFVVFTLEAFARTCVSGFLLDPDVTMSSLFRPPSKTTTFVPSSAGATVTRSGSLSQTSLHRGVSITKRLAQLKGTLLRPFALSTPSIRSPYMSEPRPSEITLTNPTVLSTRAGEKINGHSTPPDNAYSSSTRSDKPDVLSLPFKLSIAHIHQKAQRNIPYLRQSWTRIDFIAVISFWIAFGLAIPGLERGSHHIGVFRALSVLRTARLLTITSGTTTIMHSLKTARPLLTRVAYFVLFAMILFSIIGIQSFKGSLRRRCMLVSALGTEASVELDSQFCGGHVDPVSLNVTGYLQLDGSPSEVAKGYICPIGQVCQEQANPSNGVENFDAIYYSALQVVIVASANGWAPLMYSMIDAEFFVSCFFFIICIIVLNFWLINLFVAVITNTFSAIRTETNKSAFGAAPLAPIEDDQDDGWTVVDGRRASRSNLAKVIHEHTRWCWVLLALASLALQATRQVDVGDTHELLLYYGELFITFAFDLEIVLRILAALPDWRTFFAYGNNWLDLVLAIGSSVIQIPAIYHSSVYPWFTIFQLGRFYRVILVIPRMRPLLLAVFGNLYGLANMTLFLLLVNYIAALVSVQLLRGDMGEDDPMNFGEVFNAFLGVYQVFSSENWTDILYGTTAAELRLGQTAIVALFVVCWLLFANFIMLQMFIAVINENFQIAEEAKKGKQTSKYLATQNTQRASATWLRKLNPYRWFKPNPVSLKVENLPANLVLPMQKSLVQDYSIRRFDSAEPKATIPPMSRPGHYSSKSLNALERLFAGSSKSNDVPLATLRQARAEASAHHDEEIERHLELLASVNPETATAEEVNDALYELRAQKADFIRDHPTYDKTFWIFSQKNWLRRMCQKVVQPANGDRIFGTPHSPIAHPIFQLIVLLTVIGGIVVESIATPVYRRNYFLQHGFHRGAWFDIAEAAFGFTLVVEFLIKIIADGFLFTPNAYIRSIWNILDFIVMVGILVNVITGLVFVGGLSRFTRSLKALRALRLITLIDKMRDTFQSLILSGISRILDAAILAILYMIPYAVWGLNIFAGKMNTCNDGDAGGIGDCVGEYSNTVYGDSFGFLVPRVWDNPSPSTTFSFDSFRASLLILFEIVSLEGWTDVMNVATSITGRGLQPSTNHSEANAIFFVIYNLLGGVVIFTLFVSIIISNFSSKTGSAFLTQAQREWIDLQKLFKRQRPSKRPKSRPKNPVRAWCFDRAVHKHGWWSRAMTFLFLLHIIALMTQTFTMQVLADTFRNDFFLALMFIYLIDVAVRLFGLGWKSYRANGWNLFDIIVATGSFVTTLIVRFGSTSFAIQQLQKLFLVSIAFKLVQRTNSLNMLFKTAVASLPVILSLLGLWLILFIFFAILYVEVFSLTKWGSGENRNKNYTSMGSAMVMLAFMSVGEGWNQYMHDFTLDYPRCTNIAADATDCGSEAWALALFIAWNLLSMYIFVNMFTGVVVENFSYVFQTSAGGTKSITREQMRAFKKVWAEFANTRTGYLERHRFVPFFARLSGAFEVRIYPAQYSIPLIMEACRHDADYYSPHGLANGLDIGKLNRVLSEIDYTEIRKRRALYSRLYHEASISHQSGRGISFTDMLLLLAHHKFIVDSEALVLKDLVIRTETNKLVTDLVNLDRVRSLLKTISCRRRFLAWKERMRMEKEIPSIVVESLPESPSSPRLSSGYASPQYDNPNYGSQPNSPSYKDRKFSTPDVSLALDSSPKLHRSSRRISVASALSASDIGHTSPRSSIVETDPQHVLSSLENSTWGNLMLEAAKEDERM